MEITIKSQESDATLNITKQQNGVFCFEIDDPWCGDSEAGFGATVRVYFNSDEAAKIREFVNAAIPG